MSVENSGSEKISKKSWSGSEDTKLLKLIDELGTSGCWAIISAKMGDRSGKQCRERYHNHLKSEINKSPFTKEEDDLLTELQRTMGNQWARISRQFTGRSDNAVKNRWHIMNRNKSPPDVEVPKAPVAKCTSPLVVRKHPVVPKLALTPPPVVTAFFPVPSADVVTSVKGHMGLQSTSFDHSHSHNNHYQQHEDKTDSNRSSGRKSTRSGRGASSSTAAPRHTITLEQAQSIANEFRIYPSSATAIAPITTVATRGRPGMGAIKQRSQSSVVSDTTTTSNNSNENEDDDDDWLDELIISASSEEDDEDNADNNNNEHDDDEEEGDAEGDDWSCHDNNEVFNLSHEDLSTLVNNNIFAEESIISPRDENVHILLEETNSLPFVETPKMPIVRGSALEINTFNLTSSTHNNRVSGPELVITQAQSQHATAGAVKVYDTFSEAALSHREDPSEYDYDESESHDCYNIYNNVQDTDNNHREQEYGDVECDDLFLLFDDNLSICSKPSPQYVSPHERHHQQRFQLNKLSEITPRNTPRSPACPNVKRHRGVQPGGSPFKTVPVA